MVSGGGGGASKMWVGEMNLSVDMEIGFLGAEGASLQQGDKPAGRQTLVTEPRLRPCCPFAYSVCLCVCVWCRGRSYAHNYIITLMNVGQCKLFRRPNCVGQTIPQTSILSTSLRQSASACPSRRFGACDYRKS